MTDRGFLLHIEPLEEDEYMKNCQEKIDLIRAKQKVAINHRAEARHLQSVAEEFDAVADQKIAELAEEIASGHATTGNRFIDWCILTFKNVWDTFLARMHGIEKQMQEHVGELILIVINKGVDEKAIFRSGPGISEKLIMGVLDDGFFEIGTDHSCKFPITKFIEAVGQPFEFNGYLGGIALSAGKDDVNVSLLDKPLGDHKRPNGQPYYELEILIGNQKVADWFQENKALKYREAYNEMAQILKVDVRLAQAAE